MRLVDGSSLSVINHSQDNVQSQPPMVTIIKDGEAYSRLPLVYPNDFCSRHESAFEDEGDSDRWFTERHGQRT